MGYFVENGWLSSVGILLNQQCVNCQVWIGVDEKDRRIEFDGLPHVCPKFQRFARKGAAIQHSVELHNGR